MEVLEAIASRRSIRKFLSTPVPHLLLEKILEAGTLAPSGKNAQPWDFTVLEGPAKERLLMVLEQAVAAFSEQGRPTGSAPYTIESLRQAPVCIVVYNWRGNPQADHNGLHRYGFLVDVQSIGAAIQNMLLAAVELGLGSLWICDVLYAEREIAILLNRKEELVAVIAIGYAAEEPLARPRKSWREMTKWEGNAW
ncbi:MAG: putative NAD(P)H nitroreductase YdjA [Firmicutes bacterium]|nr:putative NAD(P)H nitroreductase YdjA [Bacillota bacterium]